MFQKMLVVDGITERYGPCAVNATKTNDGLRNAIRLQVFSFISFKASAKKTAVVKQGTFVSASTVDTNVSM